MCVLRKPQGGDNVLTLLLSKVWWLYISLIPAFHFEHHSPGALGPLADLLGWGDWSLRLTHWCLGEPEIPFLLCHWWLLFWCMRTSIDVSLQAESHQSVKPRRWHNWFHWIKLWKELQLYLLIHFKMPIRILIISPCRAGSTWVRSVFRLHRWSGRD